VQTGRPPILIAGDEAPTRRWIERVLSSRYTCELARNVDEARDKLGRGSFHLALCDIHLRGESGLVLAEEIHSRHAQTSIVLIDGEADPDVPRRAFELGVSGYLVKPLAPGQLLIATMNALKLRELDIANAYLLGTLEWRLQAVIDRAPIPIYVKDRSGRFTVANTVAEEVAGVEGGGLIGLRNEDIMSPEGAVEVGTSDRQVLEEEVTIEKEETLAIAGETRTYRSVKFPLIDDAGGVHAVCGISTDITAEKQAAKLRDLLALARERAIGDLQASRQETVERLARAIELRDVATGEHVARIGGISAFLGRQLGLNEGRVALIRAAAPMHDVGKIAIADHILLKPGALAPEERAEMERHTTIGHELLANSESDLLQLAAVIALTHHERFDGTGYPRRLADGAVPIEGRIVAVADVFDALLSDRSYRPALSVDEAVGIIREGRGTHFDPRLADILLEHLDEVLALRG
jgi:PAS domain S-box-containing protein